MFKRIIQFFVGIRVRQIININLTRGFASMSSRVVDSKKPSSWEFSGFSQNGEDGIIDFLIKNLLKSNKYFIELGSADGLQNNTTWLLLVKNYHGLMIDGNKNLEIIAKRHVIQNSIGSNYKSIFVNLNNINLIKDFSLYLNPDLFSLDIDGNDFHIANKLFEMGVRPKIFVVEYNSAFGPVKSITSKYDENFVSTKFDDTGLYFGASITAWKKLFKKYNYHFITVDTNGVNAFFVDSKSFTKEFLNKINGLNYEENKFFLNKFKGNHEKQYKLISKLEYIVIK